MANNIVRKSEMTLTETLRLLDVYIPAEVKEIETRKNGGFCFILDDKAVERALLQQNFQEKLEKDETCLRCGKVLKESESEVCWVCETEMIMEEEAEMDRRDQLHVELYGE